MESSEIITLQLGNYSNFIGSHYWNFQQKRYSHEEEESSKLFRYNQSSPTKPFPRVICFDVKSSLRTLQEDGTLCEFETAQKVKTDLEKLLPEEDLLLLEQERYERNDFQKDIEVVGYKNLDDSVKTWTDFMKYRIHENSLQLLSDNYNDGKNFTYFGLGNQEYTAVQDGFEDKLHFWIEECNNLEGFQVFTDFHNGFCGLTSGCLENLNEEYYKKCKLAFLNTPIKAEKHVYDDINMALTLQACREFCDLSVIQSLQKKDGEPVNIDQVEYKPSLDYHTSAILAATIDSTTLSLREQPLIRMKELCNFIASGSYPFAGTAFGVPLTGNRHKTFLDKLFPFTSFYDGLMTNLSPHFSMINRVPLRQLINVQNISELDVIPCPMNANVLQSLGLNSNVFTTNPTSVVDYFSSKLYQTSETISHSFYFNKKLDISAPFPSIINFDENEAANLTTISSLYTSSSFYDVLHDLVMRIEALNLNKNHVIADFSLDKDIVKELIEDLKNIANIYDEKKAIEDFFLE